MNHNTTSTPTLFKRSLIGPGDSGKSTVLAAISLLLAPYPAAACSEFDYYRRQVADSFEIQAVITAPPDGVLAGERSAPFIRGWLNGAVSDLPDQHGAEPRAELDAVLMARKLSLRRPSRSVGTVHKAKGWEFEHVLVAPFSATHFPDDIMGRRLAYVALSRATRSVEMLVPGLAPSPLAL